MELNKEDFKVLRKYKECKKYLGQKGIEPDIYDINGNVRDIFLEIEEKRKKEAKEYGCDYFDGYQSGLTPFENVKKYLTEKGVDSSLLEIPEIKKRLERMEQYFNIYTHVPTPFETDVSLYINELDKMKNKIIVREDGTFEYGELQVSRCYDESKKNCLQIKEHYFEYEDVVDEIFGEDCGVITKECFDDVIVDENGLEVEGNYKKILTKELWYEDEKIFGTETKSRKREKEGMIEEEHIKEGIHETSYLRKIGEDGKIIEEKKLSDKDQKDNSQENVNISASEKFLSCKDIARADKEQALTTTEVGGIKGILSRIRETFKGKGEK